MDAQNTPSLPELQGGLSNEQLRAGLASKLQPGTQFTDAHLTGFALGVEWAYATPIAAERDRHHDTALVLTGQLQQAREHADAAIAERDRLREEVREAREAIGEWIADSARKNRELGTLRTLNTELADALQKIATGNVGPGSQSTAAAMADIARAALAKVKP